MYSKNKTYLLICSKVGRFLERPNEKTGEFGYQEDSSLLGDFRMWQIVSALHQDWHDQHANFNDECVQKSFLPLSKSHGALTLFWPDCAPCHYARLSYTTTTMLFLYQNRSTSWNSTQLNMSSPEGDWALFDVAFPYGAGLSIWYL